jgi:hypothetical protein
VAAAWEQITIRLQPLPPGGGQIHGQGLGGLALGGRCLAEQFQALLDPSGKASLQVVVIQEREQGGGEPQAQPRGLERIGRTRFEQLEQGQVALEQGLEEPVFLQ